MSGNVVEQETISTRGSLSGNKVSLSAGKQPNLLFFKHWRQPQISLFWSRFGSGLNIFVNNRKSMFLLILTYYFEATVPLGGISSYFPERLFIIVPL